jgi:uncharacterized protein
MEILNTSKYLHTVPRTDGFAIFHSLFGRLSHVDLRTKELLDTLRHPEPIDKIISRYSGGNAPELTTLIEELQSRSFLVPADTDEYETVQRDMRFRELCIPSGYLVRALQLIISNQCNFGCKFCFFKDHTSASRLDLAGRESNMQMSLEMARMAIENVLNVQRKHGHQSLAVEFFGGEPLMNWPVIKNVLETYGRHGQNGFPKINYSITTNGKALTREMAALFKKYDVTVTISYNFPTTPEELDPEKYSNFHSVKQSLELLNEIGNSLTFNTVLSTDALKYFDSKTYVDFCRHNNVQMIGLILDLNLEFYKDPANSGKAIETIMTTYQYAKQLGIPVVGYWHEPFAQITGHQALNFDSGFKCCPGEGCKLSVEPEGHLFVCKGCSERIGHISDLEKTFSHPKYKEYAFHAYRNAPACDGCIIENFCSTGCMGSIERHYKTIGAVDNLWCEVFKELTLRLIRQMEPGEFGTNQFSFPAEVR